jgi:hypothetical protein
MIEAERCVCLEVGKKRERKRRWRLSHMLDIGPGPGHLKHLPTSKSQCKTGTDTGT